MKEAAKRLYPRIHFQCNCCVDSRGNHRPFRSLKELFGHYKAEHQRVK